MVYNFNQIKEDTKKIVDWLKQEFSGIRTGRASPLVLDGIRVEAYGGENPINQIASVSIEDVRIIRISPWDMGLVKNIEKAIQVSNLGLSVSVDEKGLRVIFPELTAERRQDFVKIAKSKLEEARVRLRNEREKILKDFDKQKKDGEISEDEVFKLKIELQKIVDETGRVFEENFNKKEKEITE